MKRVILRGPQQVAFEDVPLHPDDVSDGQFYAETECSAVSIGTETAAYLGHPPLRPGTGYPRVVGYCNVARVRRIRGRPEGVSVGDRIFTCQAHQSAFIASPREVLAVIPDSLSPSAASLTYLAQLGLAALQKAAFQPGERVAVLGLGVIGLATVQVATVLGAQVVALGNSELRIRKAEELGARAAFRSDDPQLASRVAAATGGAGIDVLITTANSWEAWRVALEITRPQGRIAVLGFPGRSEGPPTWNPLDSAWFYAKQLSLLAVGDVPAPALERNMGRLLQLMAEGRLPLERLLTHRVPWQALGQIYELASRKDKALIGAVLEWDA